MFKDPTNASAPITPEQRQWHKAEREAIYRHTMGDEVDERQLACKQRWDATWGQIRQEELRARDWLRKNGVVLPERPTETIQGPMGRPRLANRTVYRDLLSDWNAGRWGFPNLLPSGLTAQAKTYPRITCDSCGTDYHGWYWCIQRRRNASEDAKYRGERVVEGDEILTLAEVPGGAKNEYADGVLSSTEVAVELVILLLMEGLSGLFKSSKRRERIQQKHKGFGFGDKTALKLPHDSIIQPQSINRH